MTYIPLHHALQSSPPSTIASALLFGTLTFTYASLFARTWLSGDTRPLSALSNPKSSQLDLKSFQSIFILCHHCTIFGLILLFAYICEYHPPFPHGEKSYDRDEFFFVTAVMFLAAAFTVKRNDGGAKKENREKKGEEVRNGDLAAGSKQEVVPVDGDREDDPGRRLKAAPVKAANDVLNRDQTEEWKGWMQYIFLLYHYYHAEEVYNSIRIMITCYVWMTGFGNFSFFYLKGDYSAVRVIQMLWRLNFLVIFLCLSQGTTYILYYICLLHTYFFLVVYFSMRIGSHLNYTKYGLRIKLGVVALLIFLMWDVDSGLFRLVHFPFLGQTPMLGATNGSLWEWYFRSTLDHWSTFLGMIFAANFPITSLFYRKLESLPFRHQWAAKGSVGIAFFMAFYTWLSGPFQQPKLAYNATNAYFGFIPLITYIYFRNLTPSLRSYSLDLFHQLGKTTLETYLMQHHIWLTSDAKSLLILIPGWPRVNMLVTTVIYYYTSRRLYKMTLFLRGMFLPDDRNFCYKSLAGIITAIGLFYAVALSLTVMKLNNLITVAIISILCGFCLYQFVMDTTWNNFRETAPPMSTGPDSFLDAFVKTQQNTQAKLRPKYPNEIPESPIARLSPPIIASMVLFVIGLTWRGCALSGAGKITPLPSHCEAFVNNGKWIPIHPCNEAERGQAYRDYELGNLACRNPVHAWGWNVTRSSTHCRFTHRDPKSLKKNLEGRHLMFMGDSMTRNMYHATLRMMGVQSGFYDATIPKHADIQYSLQKENIQMEFKWAPLAVDQLQIFKESNAKKADEIGLPDLIVTGGGAWDRLHVYATDEDQTSLKITLKELAKEIKVSKEEKDVPVVWTIPTVIHTKALNHEEKRDHMKEEDMEEMRVLYASLGVLASSSFVLDGPAFTQDRVEESFDGVHYPPAVYDGGAQILANALDWILLELKNEYEKEWNPPQPGKMANPYLGLMMLCFVFIGLYFFDGFMGFSYLAGVFVRGVMPNDLYEEAFEVLHRKMKLPAIEMETMEGRGRELKNVDDEIASLLADGGGNSGDGLERRSSGNVAAGGGATIR